MLSEIEKRSAEIREEMKVEGADIKALIEEAEGLKTRKAEIIAEQKAKQIEAEERKADINAVIGGKGKEITVKEEKKIMTDKEIRSSKEYIDAFARYLLNENKAGEVRALLTEDAEDGTVPVPTFVDGRIRTAWDNNDIVRRITKSYFKGNLDVGYEISGTDAVKHTEGAEAPAEEVLTLGKASLVADYYKKWITVSDRVLDIGMGGQSMVDYLYREFAHKITKAIADDVVAQISASAIVGAITEAPALTTISNALAQLSDEASEPVIIMNRATEPEFISAFVGGNFAYDPFRNMPVLYNNSLDAYDDASSNEVYAIVGDLKAVQGNFPNGEDIKYIFDTFTYAEANLVKIVGKLLGAVAVTQPGAFTLIKKA